MIKAIQKVVFVLLMFSVNSTSFASTSVIEVGEGVLPAHTTTLVTTLTPFTRIDFASPFPSGVTPNVFTMTPEFGTGVDDDPCLIRIKNISNTGFDATCLEPLGEDRDIPGVTFDYIAIQNGTTTIPTTTGGSVVFESACPFVNVQTNAAPRCANCDVSSGIPVGSQTVNFINTFTNAPAVLTELTTTNNSHSGNATTPGGEPEFLNAAVTSINSSSFETSIDRLEAGNGVLSNGETMCYLAVERQGCQSLDLSGINGSETSVAFESTFGDNVDGHDNGSTTGEGATFDSGCFSATPVGVADMRSRNGNNGGFIRLADINSTEIITLIDEDRVSDTERSHIDEDISVLAFSGLFTTPVTLNKAKIHQLGRNVTFDWETSAESFHLGFHLWGETGDGWVQINNKIIPGEGVNTNKLTRYSKRVRLSRQEYNEIQRFGISSVDSSGVEEFYGPFEAGQEYGEDNTSEAIDWQQTRKEHDQRMLDNGFVKVGKRWRKNSASLSAKIDRRNERRYSRSLDVRFDNVGIHKVLLSELLEQQPTWQGRPISNLAVTLNDQAVSRQIISDDDVISADDVLVFNVVAPQGRDQVYLKDYTYRITTDRSKALAAAVFDGHVTQDIEFDQKAYIEQIMSNDLQYSRVITSGSPWYDYRLLSVQNEVQKEYFVSYDKHVLNEENAFLSFSVFGGIDLPDEGQDHHVQIKVNDVLVYDASFDGFTELKDNVTLPASLLTGNNDKVSVVLPGDTGLFADLVLIDQLSVIYPTELNVETASQFIASNDALAYQINTEIGADKMVYAFTDSGLFSVVNVNQENGQVSFKTLPLVQSVNNSERINYSVVSIDDLAGPVAIEQNPVSAIHEQASDLLIVAHPVFIGEELNSYVEFKATEGYSPKVISWLDIVGRYGYGNNTPEALNNFLMQAKNIYTPENLLLVGGHTYDYLDTLETGAVNFIPTHYRRVSSAEFAPADNVFADLDGDNLPELSIGRWPVRSITDLSVIIAKSRAWQNKRSTINNQTAILIAQDTDSRNLNFEASLNGRIVPQLKALEQFSDPLKVYLGQIQSEGQAIQDARDIISEALNDGADLISFAGHGSTSGWGFQGVVNTQFIQGLSNHDDPVVVMPLACYTTDYQSLSTNTLAHQWLFSGTQGAAAVHGSAMLGEYRENGVFAERFLKQSQTNDRLGEAIKQAKRKMGPSNQMLHNWTLLGDPTLLIN